MILWTRWCSVGCWKSTKTNFKKAWQLSRGERWLLLQAFLALPLVSLGLRCWGLRRLQARLLQQAARARRSSAPNTGLDQARTTARLVQAAARHGVGSPRCLTQSLVLWYLLQRQGIDGVLRIGVKPPGYQLEAHAWVELEGQILNDHDDVYLRFAPFPGAIPAEKSWGSQQNREP